MMDAPMHDVVASIPLADDVREALVLRKGQKGELLDCVVALETGDYDEAPTIVDGAGELYATAWMCATPAAAPLPGDPEAAPGRAEVEPAIVAASAPAALPEL